MKYRVHRLDIKMTSDQRKLEQFLDSLEGEVVGIIPNVTIGFLWVHRVDSVLIAQKLG
ncbi:MAG: hypothetical protein MUP64_05630 [Anaerolineae bacterium]|nr:hypothetical protein [Anaerolineae bacterium]